MVVVMAMVDDEGWLMVVIGSYMVSTFVYDLFDYVFVLFHVRFRITSLLHLILCIFCFSRYYYHMNE